MLLTLRNYNSANENALKIYAPWYTKIYNTDGVDVTENLLSAGIFMSSFNSSSLIVADALKSLVAAQLTDATVVLSVDGAYDVASENDLDVIVSPLTTVIGRDARDVIRERVATQITIIKRTGTQNTSVDAIINSVESLQTSLFFADITDDSKRWTVEQIEQNSNTLTSGGTTLDGIYDGTDLGDAGVFKTTLIVVACRFLKAVRA